MIGPFANAFRFSNRLLPYTGRPIKHLSFELGFEDMSHFPGFFKKI